MLVFGSWFQTKCSGSLPASQPSVSLPMTAPVLVTMVLPIKPLSSPLTGFDNRSQYLPVEFLKTFQCSTLEATASRMEAVVPKGLKVL